MAEDPPKNIEPGPETAPTLEEIAAVFEKLTGTKEYTQGPRLEDEKGIYRWEIRVETEDGYIEYEYNRTVINPLGKVPKTVVFATYYDKDGMPISGSTVAQLINNTWNTQLIDLRTWLPKNP